MTANGGRPLGAMAVTGCCAERVNAKSFIGPDFEPCSAGDYNCASCPADIQHVHEGHSYFTGCSQYLHPHGTFSI